MGANVSQEINAAASSSLSVVNSQVQDCVQQGSQSEVISICAGQGCGSNSTVNITGNVFQEAALYTTQCAADVNITQDIQNTIAQQFSQQAQAIAQQFQLSAANVNEVANISANISTNITTMTVNNCITTVSQTEGININCGNTGGGICNINVTANSFNETLQPYTNCILQDTQVQNVVNQVTQIIQQQGTAKVESIFGPLIALLVIILLIVGVVFFSGTKALTDWRLWVVVIILVLIYLGIAFWRHWFPFER